MSKTQNTVNGFSGKMVRSGDHGATWQPVITGATQALYAMWGSAANHIYVVGDGRTVLHSTDGTSWQPQTAPGSGRLCGVWGSSASDLYAVGDRPSGIIHTSGDGTWFCIGRSMSRRHR